MKDIVQILFFIKKKYFEKVQVLTSEAEEKILNGNCYTTNYVV